MPDSIIYNDKLRGKKSAAPGIYPNPVISHFKILLEEKVKEVTVTILNAEGLVVYKRQHNGSSRQVNINASNLSAGYYTVAIETEDSFSTQTIIKL